MCFKKKVKINIENLGVIPDPRPEEEKNRDYKAEEIFSFAPIEWKEKPEADWRKFPIFNQDSSSSCVAQAVAKTLGIENWLEEKKFVQYSARDIYSRRSNIPGEGMYFQQGLDIGYRNGATIEQLMPSQGLSEQMMNITDDRTPLTEIVAKIVKGGNYLILQNDIETIASVIEPTGKPVVLGVRFGDNEWNKQVPTINGTTTKWGHAICATNAILYQGKKSLVIEDSWGIDSGFNGRRILTQDWFDAGRVVFAGYFAALDNAGLDTKPKYQFLIDLQYGMANNNDVKKLQECLSYLKMFPSGQTFTGNFYGVTLKAVQLFQTFYGVSTTDGKVGLETRQKLNRLFK